MRQKMSQVCFAPFAEAHAALPPQLTLRKPAAWLIGCEIRHFPGLQLMTELLQKSRTGSQSCPRFFKAFSIWRILPCTPAKKTGFLLYYFMEFTVLYL